MTESAGTQAATPELLGAGNPIEVWDWVDCALNALSKVPRRKYTPGEDAVDYYDTFFSDLDVATFAEDTDPRRTLRAEVLKRVVVSGAAPGGRLLDVGCGIGDNLRIFSASGLELHGIEYSDVSARHAAKLLGANALVRTGSATALPYPDGSFDAAICIEVLEHVGDDVAAIKEISRVLKPNGLLVMSVPYRHYFRRYLKTMGHFRHYTRETAVGLLREGRLEPVEYLPNYPRWSRFANYVHVTCRASAAIPRLFGVRCRPHEVRLPFCSRPLMTMLFDRLAPLRRVEDRFDYASASTSTFIAARRK